MNSFNKLSRRALRVAFRNGLGCALLYVRENGDHKIKDLLSHACLNHLAFDSQIEGFRTDWFADIIQMTEDPAMYCAEIERAFLTSHSDRDIQRLASLIAGLGKRGHKRMRSLLYEVFEGSVKYFKSSYPIGMALVEMDGLDAFETIVDCLEHYPPAENLDDLGVFTDPCVAPSCDDGCAAQLKEEEVISRLKELAKKRPRLKKRIPEIQLAMKDRGYRYGGEPDSTISKQERPPLSLKKLLTMIESGNTRMSGMLRFAREANDADIDRVYNLLLKETRPKQLRGFLRFFSHRPLPRVGKRVIELASFGRGQVRRNAMQALAQTQDESIRRLAKRMIKSDPKSIYFGSLKLFENNYVPADLDFFRNSLKTSPDPDITHWVASDMLSIADKGGKELTDCVLWAYENTPCGFCRDSAIRRLIEWQTVPKEVLEECIYDSYHYTQVTAKAALEKLEKRKTKSSTTPA